MSHDAVANELTQEDVMKMLVERKVKRMDKLFDRIVKDHPKLQGVFGKRELLSNVLGRLMPSVSISVIDNAIEQRLKEPEDASDLHNIIFFK